MAKYTSIQKFDSNGNPITQWGSTGTGTGEFNGACSIAVDDSNNVYVSENGNNRIQIFDSGGNFLFAFGGPGSGNGEFSFPDALCVDKDGKIYVRDLFNYRVQVFDNTGNYLSKWGQSGSDDGEFSYSSFFRTGIAARNGVVFISDPGTGNNRVQIFDTNGIFLTKFGSTGTEAGEFNNPTGIALDANNNVYVVEYSNNRIQKFSQ